MVPVATAEYAPDMQWQLLDTVPAAETRLVLSIARRRRFKKGEVVFHRQDPGDSLHLVSSGRFAVQVMTPLGQLTTVAIRGPGAHFGEMALVSGDTRRAATVIALEPAETFAVFHEDFARLRKQHPELDEALIAFLADEVRLLNDRLLEALYLPVEKRVLRRLAELGATYTETENRELTIPLTQEEIAALAGATRATVNRVLRLEQERDTLRLERGRVIVTDRDAIERRARAVL